MGLPLPLTWTWSPPVLLGLALAAVLYMVGMRYSLRSGLTRAVSPWRTLAYFAGLLVIYVALLSPVDVWADTYLTAHMAQHILLIFIAAPLLVLSAPLMLVWRAVPLDARRDSLRWTLRHPRLRRTAVSVGQFVMRPKVAWILFVGDFLGWHLPAMYNLALRNQTVHDLEHMCFLGTGLLFWAQLIHCPPLHARMDYGVRALYLFSSSVATSIVSLALVYIPTPIYNYYATAHVPGGPGVIVDQASAGALMDVAVAPIFALAFCLLVWKWLETDEERAPSLVVSGRKVRPVSASNQPTFKGKPLRWTPLVLQGAGATAAPSDHTDTSAHP